jgi:hypothetical protein
MVKLSSGLRYSLSPSILRSSRLHDAILTQNPTGTPERLSVQNSRNGPSLALERCRRDRQSDGLRVRHPAIREDRKIQHVNRARVSPASRTVVVVAVIAIVPQHREARRWSEAGRRDYVPVPEGYRPIDHKLD